MCFIKQTDIIIYTVTAITTFCTTSMRQVGAATAKKDSVDHIEVRL